MAISIRPARADDASACGQICYSAFHGIATAHSFPPDFPSPDVATGFLAMVIAHPETYAVVAETDGRVAGSNFLWEQSDIAGVGPITVDGTMQNGSVGRRLMEAVLERGAERGFAGIRLVQAAYHNRSLSLYTKLGFDTREPLSNLQGAPIAESIPGHDVRPAKEADIAACNALCRKVHGHDRRGEVRDAVAQGSAMVVEREGRITGYSTVIGFFGHAAAETNGDLIALIAAAPEFAGPGMLVPTRNGEVLRWCLQKGLRIVQPLTLMSRGFYQEPQGAFLPSILF